MDRTNRIRSVLSVIHRHPRICEGILTPCILFGIFWIFLGRFLGGDRSVATWLDNTYFILPLFSHISKVFAAGEFPYWINSISGGIPLYNTPQFSLLYPFYFFKWNLYQSPVDALLQVHFVILLHVGILLINTYVMLRIFRLGIASSLLGATLFAFCANTIQYLFWVNIIAPYSWLPLALGSFCLILENRRPKVGLVLGWVSIYLLVSASPAQPLIHLVYCMAFLFLAYWIIYRKDPARRYAPIRNLVLLAVGSILLSAVSLIPPVLFARSDMIRWIESGAIVGNQTIPFESFLTGQVKARELAKVLFPLNVQQLLGDSYLGLLPVFLAVFGLFKSRQNWIVIPLFILALYTAFSSVGDNLGFAYINYLIPLWNKVREPGRHLYLFALATCTLAAFGFEHLTGWIKQSWKSDLRNHALAFGLFLILLVVSYRVRQNYQSLIKDPILLWSFLLFLLVLVSLRVVPRSAGLGKGLLAATVIYPALHYPVYIVPLEQGDYFTAANLHSHRVLKEVATLADIRKYRLVVADNQLSTQYWSMNASYYGLRTFEAFMNPLPYQEQQQMFSAPAAPHYAQLLGARYYLDCRDQVLAPPHYVLERQIEGCKLYSTSQVRPHYFLSDKVGNTYKDMPGFLDMIQQSDDYMSKISVESKDRQEIAAWLGAATTPLTWETFHENVSHNTLSVGLRTNRTSLLVLNEYFRDEWNVTINGESRKPFRVNLNQIAVPLPEGTNEVRFEYRPRLFLWLSYLKWTTIAAMAVALLGMARSARTKLNCRLNEVV